MHAVRLTARSNYHTMPLNYAGPLPQAARRCFSYKYVTVTVNLLPSAFDYVGVKCVGLCIRDDPEAMLLLLTSAFAPLCI
jgi:hypothetical protein